MRRGEVGGRSGNFWRSGLVFALFRYLVRGFFYLCSSILIVVGIFVISSSVEYEVQHFDFGPLYVGLISCLFWLFLFLLWKRYPKIFPGEALELQWILRRRWFLIAASGFVPLIMSALQNGSIHGSVNPSGYWGEVASDFHKGTGGCVRLATELSFVADEVNVENNRRSRGVGTLRDLMRSIERLNSLQKEYDECELSQAALKKKMRMYYAEEVVHARR